MNIHDDMSDTDVLTLRATPCPGCRGQPRMWKRSWPGAEPAGTATRWFPV